MVYIKREELHTDTLYGEDTLNSFKDSHTIEMYVESIENFGGQNEFLSKFGFEINDKSEFLVNAKRFTEETTQEKPEEGDLVLWPLVNKLFTITFVDTDYDFYELGKNFNYKLSLELFTYNQEVLETDIPQVDGLEDIDFESEDPKISTLSDNVIADEVVDDETLLDITNI